MTSKKITLDLWKNNSELLTVKQGEVNSRFLEITLKDVNGPLNLSNKSVKFQAKKSDGNIIYNSASIIDETKGIIVVGLTAQMSAVSGPLNNCEIVVTDELGNSLIVGGINIFVTPSLCETVEKSMSELTAFKEISSAINDLKEHVSNENNPHKVSAEQIGALSDLPNYGSSLAVDGTTLNLKDQNGNILDTVTTQDTTYLNATNNTNGLMSSTDKSKLDTIEENAQKNVQADWNSSDSTSFSYIKNKPLVPSAITDLSGTLPINQGGTGSTSANTALTNLGAAKATDIGNVSNLNTSSSTLVGAINELSSSISGIGDISNLSTASPTLVDAINEVSSSTSSIGNIYELNTASSTLVEAINNLSNSIGDLSLLSVTGSSLVEAINEVYNVACS